MTVARMSFEERDRVGRCYRFNVTRDDVRRWGGCTYYGDPYPDGAINWIGPQVREGGTVYCDHHWAQVQAERAERAR